MIILHAALCEDHLFLWGEAPPDQDGGASSTAKPAPLPYNAAAEDLVQALTETGSRLEAKRAEARVVWLPTHEGTPLPSSPLIADVPTDEAAPELAAWGVTALPLSVEEAVDFLSACVGKEMLAPGVILGSDVVFLTKGLRFAGTLVAREQFVPGLVERDNAFRARWEPVFIGDDAGRLALLAGAMPHACRALTRTPDTPPDRAPAAVLTQGIGDWVDYLVRAGWLGTPLPSPRAKGTFASIHDQWLHALRTPDGAMQGNKTDLAHLADQTQAWRRSLSISTETPFRLCFRLEEPDLEEASDTPIPADPGPWHVRYLLQATDDPSLLVEVADAWAPGKQTAALFARHRFNVHLYLLAALGQATSLYPTLEASLKTPQPGGCKLDTSSAYAFLTETAWLLQQAGFGVLLPSWWTRRGTRQRLSAQATVRSPKMQGGSGLSLDTIVQFDWQVALGEERLSRQEIEALARLKVPLVKLRGQWVQVDGEAIQAALDFWKKKDAGEVSVMEVVRMALGMAQAPGGLPFEGVEATGWVGDLLHQLEHGAAVEELPTPEAFEGTLRPYQTTGYSWMAFLQRWGFGACLADDMGLGKTIEALALIQRNWDANGQQPVLLVCPTSVMGTGRKRPNASRPICPSSCTTVRAVPRNR